MTRQYVACFFTASSVSPPLRHRRERRSFYVPITKPVISSGRRGRRRRGRRGGAGPRDPGPDRGGHGADRGGPARGPGRQQARLGQRGPGRRPGGWLGNGGHPGVPGGQLRWPRGLRARRLGSAQPPVPAIPVPGRGRPAVRRHFPSGRRGRAVAARQRAGRPPGQPPGDNRNRNRDRRAAGLRHAAGGVPDEHRHVPRTRSQCPGARCGGGGRAVGGRPGEHADAGAAGEPGQHRRPGPPGRRHREAADVARRGRGDLPGPDAVRGLLGPADRRD